MLGYEEELELVKNDVKVIWTNLGEGLYGDYNEKDPEDDNLLRFEVFKKNGDEWEFVEDSSRCTYVSAETKTDHLMYLLSCLMNNFYDPVCSGASIKRLADEMSWIS